MCSARTADETVSSAQIRDVGGVYFMPASLSEDTAQAEQPLCVGLPSQAAARGGSAAPSGTPAGRADTAQSQPEPSARPIPEMGAARTAMAVVEDNLVEYQYYISNNTGGGRRGWVGAVLTRNHH